MKKELLEKMGNYPLAAIFLVGLLLLVIAIPESDTSTEDAVSETKEEMEEEVYREKMERELEELLQRVAGVGEVKVMITLSDDGGSVVEKDRNTSDGSVTEETVYDESEEGGPYVSSNRYPAIEGVVVAATGGGDATIATEISDTVLALFPIEVHKIKVVKME